MPDYALCSSLPRHALFDVSQRLFKELFYRKGFQYDNMFDWTVQNMVGFRRVVASLGVAPCAPSLIFFPLETKLITRQQQERSRLGPADGRAPADAAEAPRERSEKERVTKSRGDDPREERQKVRIVAQNLWFTFNFD